MTNQDVSTLVNLYERISAWRRNRKKQKTRIIVQRFRKKLQNAGENRDAADLKKGQGIKKAPAAKYLKQKLEVKDLLYKKGLNPALDRRFSLSKKNYVYGVDAIYELLSQEERATILKLWCKQSRTREDEFSGRFNSCQFL